jgi:hypothetical protein
MAREIREARVVRFAEKSAIGEPAIANSFKINSHLAFRTVLSKKNLMSKDPTIVWPTGKPNLPLSNPTYQLLWASANSFQLGTLGKIRCHGIAEVASLSQGMTGISPEVSTSGTDTEQGSRRRSG